MEAHQTAAAQQPPSAPSSAADAYPRWVILEQDCNNICFDDESSCSTSTAPAGDATTLAAARTSTGHLVQVSLRLAEPPAASRVFFQALDGGLDVAGIHVYAVAADSVLIRIYIQQECPGYRTDWFVYRAGAAAADPPRPPSLSLLPSCLHLAESRPGWWAWATNGTGLLRHGEDELVVAELSTWAVQPPPVTTDTEVGDAPELKLAQLYLFRSGEWSVIKAPPITSYYGDDSGEAWEPPPEWNTVVAVGDRLLCWVDLSGGVLLICDVFEDSPRLQYLRLPMDPRLGPPTNRNVCVTAGGRALKFANVFPRCCCGGAGASRCDRSLHAYTIHTWTLRMDGAGAGGSMEWVMDGMVDATELWALDAYKGLPRVQLDRPVVSMDEPHVVVFQLCERHSVKYGCDSELWLLMVDMRTKTIRSVSRQRVEFAMCLQHGLIPSNVSCFFNSRPSSGGCDGAWQRQKHIERPPAVVVVDDEQPIRDDDDDASNQTTLQSCSFAKPFSEHGSSEFFDAFLEISRYGLGGDELKEAYIILSADNGRRFRSLLRLPKNLRKNWLLMEIKASK